MIGRCNNVFFIERYEVGPGVKIKMRKINITFIIKKSALL